VVLSCANLAIHVLAGLTLFGILRHTLELGKAPAAPSVAFFTALLWVLHPLQTESVHLRHQRAESLMGLFLPAHPSLLHPGAENAGGSKHIWYSLAWGPALPAWGPRK